MLVLVFAVTQGLLYLFGLSLRKWAVFIFLVLVSIGSVVGIIQLILKIKKKPFRITVLCVFSALVFTVSVVTAPVVLFAFASEEHIVEQGDSRYLAQVVGWTDTYVYYYDYKNFLVQGRYLRITEWYGSGGFDPFKNEYEYTPKRTIYYDDEGNILDIVEEGT